MTAEQIRAERLRRKLTQREAAAQVGVPGNTWARWERGKRHPKGLSLAALARWMAGDNDL